MLQCVLLFKMLTIIEFAKLPPTAVRLAASAKSVLTMYDGGGVVNVMTWQFCPFT